MGVPGFQTEMFPVELSLEDCFIFTNQKHNNEILTK